MGSSVKSCERILGAIDIISIEADAKLTAAGKFLTSCNQIRIRHSTGWPSGRKAHFKQVQHIDEAMSAPRVPGRYGKRNLRKKDAVCMKLLGCGLLRRQLGEIAIPI